MFPVDLTDVLRTALGRDAREPDGLLHPSSHLVTPMRHIQLELAGAPMRQRPIVDEIVLKTGTMWHEWWADELRRAGLPFMAEVKMTPWLPTGWAGTADWFFYIPEARAWVLGDLKTIKGEGMTWIGQSGAKEAHLWQLSSYYWAAIDMGLPMIEGFAVYYMPKNGVSGTTIEPSVQECQMLPRWQVEGVMEHRWEVVQDYLMRLNPSASQKSEADRVNPAGFYVTEQLAPPQPREQKLVWAKDKWDVKLVPHWSAMYCPFDDELCPCGVEGQTKIGHFTPVTDPAPEIVYVPRAGYEDIKPTVTVSHYEFNRRTK